MGDSEGEVYSVNCEVLTGTNAGYAFHVVYRNELTLEGEPSDTTGLIGSRKRTETTTQKQMVETKVPVEVEKIVPTGAYTYYGWQEQEGSVYYYDAVSYTHLDVYKRQDQHGFPESRCAKAFSARLPGYLFQGSGSSACKI